MQHDREPALGLRHFKSSTGRDLIADELRALGPHARAEVVNLMKRKQRRECLPREDSHVRGDIRELRTTFEGVEYRVFYSQEGSHGEIVLALVVAVKKAQRISNAIDLAEQRLASWRAR